MSAVRIADLKARLSEHIRAVRNGRTITVLDRNTPVAQLVPVTNDGLAIRRATKRPRDLSLPRRPASKTNSLAVLIEDRGQR